MSFISELMGFLFAEVRQSFSSTFLRTGIKDQGNQENYDRGSPMYFKIIKIIEAVIIAIADILRGGYDNQK